jgi:hypothetical protein
MGNDSEGRRSYQASSEPVRLSGGGGGLLHTFAPLREIYSVYLRATAERG